MASPLEDWMYDELLEVAIELGYILSYIGSVPTREELIEFIDCGGDI